MVENELHVLADTVLDRWVDGMLDYWSINEPFGTVFSPQVYAVQAVATSYPYTITLDSTYDAATESDCELFRHGSLGSGVSGYQYIVTFDSNVGDLAALTVDGSGLTDSSNGAETTAEVRHSHANKAFSRFPSAAS